MSDTNMQIRRALVRLEIGQTADITIDGVDPGTVLIEVRAFARVRKMNINAKIDGLGVTVTRLDARTRGSIYPALDALQLGESHLFELPPALHHAVRQAASNRGRTHGVAFTCQRQPDGIRATRIGATDEEVKASKALDIKPRQTKWGLERLETSDELHFFIDAADQMRLRLSVARKAAITGWRIRCRKQDDGSMLVKRIRDKPAEALMPPVNPNYH